MKRIAAILAILILSGTLFISADGESKHSDRDYAENTVFFALDETIVHHVFCEMSGLYAEVLDDAAMAEGWHYYYTDTDESPAPTIVWEPSDGNYTTVEVLFTVKNISDLPQTFGDKVTAALICREGADNEEIRYEGTVFQQNPGQTDESGEMIMWSTKPVEIAIGDSANVSFRFDIPKDIYEKIYATITGTDTGFVMTSEFGFGDETVYVVTLNDSLILSSQYEF